MQDDEKKKKTPDLSELFNIKILGLDLGELVRSWLGVRDLGALSDPSKLEEVKRRVEERREKLRQAQAELERRFGGAVKFDYDIRARTILGGGHEFRIGGGRFFETLDRQAEGRSTGRSRRPYLRTVSVRKGGYRGEEGVREPFIEVVEGKEKDVVEVVAELPGVEEKQIVVDVEEEKVEIYTEGVRKYRGGVRLPFKVSPDPFERTYRNGVFQLKFRKI